MSSRIVKGKTGNWEIVIGLEMHAQIASESKLFAPGKNEFGSDPNENVDLFDAAIPGTLPVLNKRCVEAAVQAGVALNAFINNFSMFERKNYFYPDLPHGYQISQLLYPIVERGNVDIDLDDGNQKNIRINRLHIETDAGKSIHDQNPHESFIDLNRAGIPLMEIVTEPDLSSKEESV